MLKAGDRIPLTIEKPAVGGAMIARHEGRVVLVSGAIPGERVQATITRVAKGMAHAATATIDEPSPDRRPDAGDPLCGGCLYRHIAYPRQLEIKSRVIADAFTRIGRLELPGPVAVAASPEDGYRMRARLHVRGTRFGFFREGTHDLCDARATRQLLPATLDTLERLMAAIRSVNAPVSGIQLSENVEGSDRVVHLESAAPLDPRLLDTLMSVEGLTPGPYVTDTIVIDGASLTLRRHVQAFFQGNRYLLRDFVAHVVERVPIGATLADLYAGAGLFSIAAGVTRAASVMTVEGDSFAADDLSANASAAGIEIYAVKGAVERFLTSGVFRVLKEKLMVKAGAAGPIVETVIVDPPRTGMSPEALAAMISTLAPRIVYVSCDVATLARDARTIVDAGYRIERADAFDLFPNTPHVETVVLFVR